MEDYMKQVEAQATKALSTVNAILTQVLPKLVNQINYLTDKVKTLEEEMENKKQAEPLKNTKPAGRHQTNYSTYLKIKELEAVGLSEKEIAAKLGIPYTTTRAYLRWTTKQVEAKKADWAKREQAELQEESKPEIVTPVVEQQSHIVPPPVVEQQSNPAVPPVVTSLEDAEDNILLSYPVPGFKEWTQQDRDNNSFDNNYYPDGLTPDMLVIVRREGAFSMPYPVREINWSSEANHPVDGWRMATEEEEKQYIARCIGRI